MSKTSDALRQLITTRAKNVQTVRALLGDGTGTVAVAGTENYVWARPYGRDMPVRAYGPPYRNYAHNLPVRLEIVALGARVIHRVVGIDDLMYIGTPIPRSWGSSVPAHAPQHQLSSSGHDPVYLDAAQLLPLLMYATSPASMYIYVAPGPWWGGAALRYWEGGTTADLSTYQPTEGSARYVLIYFNDAAELGYIASTPFTDIPSLYPKPYDVNLPLPANSVPLGMVLIQGSASDINQGQVHPFRNLISMVTPTSIISDTLMLAARAAGLYRSAGSGWAEVAASDAYLEDLLHIAIVDEETWIVFREQTAASAADPLVYKTPDAGASWAQAQTGISYVQGSDIWRVCAIWQSPTDVSNIAIVIANTTADVAPQVFVTPDAGVNWTEISNTGLPVTDLAGDKWPVSLGVEDSASASFTACIAMLDDGIYYAALPTTWAKKVAVTDIVHAVISDRLDDDCWWATAEWEVIHTDDNWATYTSHLFDFDRPSVDTHTIFQHTSSFQQLVAGGFVGTYITLDGNNFEQYDAHKIGTIGAVLTGCIGDPSKLFVTDADGNLYLSLDAGISSYQRLSVTGVLAFAAIALEADVPGETADFSSLELWLKV